MKKSTLHAAVLVAALGLGSASAMAATLQLTVKNQVSMGCLNVSVNGITQISNLPAGQSRVLPIALNQGVSYYITYGEHMCLKGPKIWAKSCTTLVPNKSTGLVTVTSATKTTCPTIQ